MTNLEQARREGRQDAQRALEAGKDRGELMDVASKSKSVAARVYNITGKRSDYLIMQSFDAMLTELED